MFYNMLARLHFILFLALWMFSTTGDISNDIFPVLYPSLCLSRCRSVPPDAIRQGFVRVILDNASI